MKDACSLLLVLLAVTSLLSTAAFADSIHGCGGFVEASSALIKARKVSDAKLDYSHITVELRTVDGFLKESIQCAPNGYYFIPVYDKGSFVIKINGPQGWSLHPDKVPVVVDNTGCNGSEDINFQFTGFSISGRVLGAVTSNRYTIEATKEQYKFSNLKDYLVLPNMASVVDIEAVSYGVCGVVQMVSAGYKAKVALTHGPENVKPQVKQTDGNGNFCFEVPTGEYRLSALAPESASGLLFVPSHIDVVVKSPLLKIKFSQALVTVRGTVVCKVKCGVSVSVALSSIGGKRNEKTKTISLTDESSEFLFHDVVPGKYRVDVKRNSQESVNGEDNWCWKQSSIDVDVGVDDVKGIEFV
ncbi:hypothetical protein ACLB2K_007338 [Fragaria x ananassa]